MRTALGATRGRLLSLAVAESLVFACLGGLAGLFLGGWALRAVLPLFAGSLPAAIPIDIDARAALFTAAVSARSRPAVRRRRRARIDRAGGLVDVAESIGPDDRRLDAGARAQRARRSRRSRSPSSCSRQPA